MFNKENIIIWEKWKDPFGADILDDMNDGLGDFLDPDAEEEYDDHPAANISAKHVKVISTPMGIIPINEHTASSKIFNFWTGHTNFDITKNIFALLDTAEGVETLDIFTRYRFRISIGKAFVDSVVMNNIQNMVYDFLAENKSDETL
jgi:hypothetical protein